MTHKSWRYCASILHCVVVLLLLFSFFSQPTVPNLNQCYDHDRKGASSYEVSRKQAIVDFVKELQMDEGAFVSELGSARAMSNVLESQFAAETLASLNELDQIDTIALTTYLTQRQTGSGGFTVSISDSEVNMLASYTTVLALYRLNELDSINTDLLNQWVLQCYRGDGFFGRTPTVLGDPLWSTRQAVEILAQINRLPSDDIEGAIIQFVLDRYSSSGGFASNAGGTPSLLATYSCVVILHNLDALNCIPSISNTVNFIMSFYDSSSGAFNHDLLRDTYRPIITLEILGALSQLDKELTKQFVLSCQSHLHGAFVYRPSAVNDSSEEWLDMCNYATIILRTLGELNSLEDTFQVNHRPSWSGDNTPPTPWTEPTQPPPTISIELLVPIIVVVIIIVIFALIFLMSYIRQGKKRRTVRKRRTRRTVRK